MILAFVYEKTSLPLVDDLSRDVREPLVEGGVGEGGVARHDFDEHAVCGIRPIKIYLN